jgi:hypothetical protein
MIVRIVFITIDTSMLTKVNFGFLFGMIKHINLLRQKFSNLEIWI